MRILRMLAIAAIVIGSACGVNYLLDPGAVIDPRILADPGMHQTAQDTLRLWKKESPVVRGFYCSSIYIPAKSELRTIAPSCEFVQFHFRRSMILQSIEPLAVTRRRIDLAIKKETGESRVVLAPWGYEYDQYPEFLLWAGCRIESKADAERVVGTMLGLREGGRAVTYAHRDGPNRWNVGHTKDRDTKPRLILETDDEGNVVRVELQQ